MEPFIKKRFFYGILILIFKRVCSPICNKLLCIVFWHLSIMASITFLINLSYSISSVWDSGVHDPDTGSQIALPDYTVMI